MRKFLIALVSMLLVVGVLAGVGFLGYRLGYRHGALVSSSSEGTNALPFLRGNEFARGHLPMHGFGIGPQREFQPGFGPSGFRIMIPDRGLGFFSPILFLLQLAILGSIIWLLHKLLTGWRFTLTRPTAEIPGVEPARPVESGSQAPEEQSN